MAGETAGGTARQRAARRPRVRERPVTTPFGKAERHVTVKVPQRAGEHRYEIVAELLQTGRGEMLVRLAYSSEGRVRRGPITLRRADIQRLRAALDRHPQLKEVVVGAS